MRVARRYAGACRTSRSTARYGSRRPRRAPAARRWRRSIDSSQPQRVDLAQIQLGRRQRASRHAVAVTSGGDVRVAVAIAADPRAEADRRRVERQPRPGVRHAARASSDAQITRQRVPQRLLEDDQAAADFVERVGPLARGPRSVSHAAAISRRSASSVSSRSGIVKSGRSRSRQRLRDAAVLLHQRAARDLGRMRREHQLDLQRARRRRGARRPDTPPRRRRGKRFVARAESAVARLGSRR